MKTSRIYFLFLLFFLFVPSVNYAQSRNSKSNSTQTFNKTFKGRLGEPIDVGIVMKLKRTDNSLSGTVYDESTKKTSKVRGTINTKGHIKLSEYSGTKRTGTWEGNLDSANQFSGSYSPDEWGDGAKFRLVSQ